jgi:hypothetical protein
VPPPSTTARSRMRSPHDGQAQPSTANTRFKSSAQQKAPAPGTGPSTRPFPSFLTSRSERRASRSAYVELAALGTTAGFGDGEHRRVLRGGG